MKKRSEWTEEEWLSRMDATLYIGIFLGFCVGLLLCIATHELELFVYLK